MKRVIKMLEILWQKRTFVLCFLITASLLTGFGNPKITKKVAGAEKTANQIAYNDFHLLISKLNINAPVIADVNGADKNIYLKALEKGVAHFRGTAKPGEGSNIFIFGHSSFYRDKPGDFKEVFRYLEDLQKNDEITLWYNQKEYQYIVFDTKIVDPSDVEVLKKTPEEQLTLMTCVPPGTTLKRLIVTAKPKL